MESNNPAFRKNTFAFVRDDASPMTLSGAINKSGLLFLILMVFAAVGWSLESLFIGIAGAILGLITSLFVIYKPQKAAIGAPLYAAFDGLFIGTISVIAENSAPGVAANAMTLTFGIMALMLFSYRMGWLRATPLFTKAIVFATLGIGVVYLVNMIMMMFGSSMAMIHEAKPVGIAFSVIVAGVASLNLILDFDLFERQTALGAPKYMEWYCGFSLLVTVVWIYVEMLRLLSKLSRR